MNVWNLLSNRRHSLAPPSEPLGLGLPDEVQGEVGGGAVGAGMKKFLPRPSAMVHR
jgi:hypothetical protein